MNNQSKTNTFKSKTTLNSTNMSASVNQKESIRSTSEKNEGCNDWSSVPKTYDMEDSCEKNEKTATNNQWCSTSK